MRKGKWMSVFYVWSMLVISCVLLFLNGCGGGSSGGGPVALQSDAAAVTEQAALDAAPEALDMSQAPAGRTGASVWGGCPGTPPPQGAWSADSGAASPDLAFDGDHSTPWISASQKEWDIYYGAGTNPGSPALELDFLHVNFFSDAYTPATTQLYISNDPCNGWTDMGYLVTGGDTSNPYIDLGSATMTNYIWIHMVDSATKTVSIRDVDWEPVNLNVGAHAWPSHDADVYYPSKAFDGSYTSSNSWVGKVSAGAWSFYYDFGAARDLDMVTAHLFNINYHPTTMTLYTSDTGTNGSWTEVGKMGPLADAAQYVGDNVRYVRIDMNGNPPSTFPYITEITWDIPEGASSGDSMNTTYKPSNAFDGPLNTWWVGDSTQSHWELFYRYPYAKEIDDITIFWYATSHMPQTTTLYCFDGSSWTNEGTFPMSATAVKSVNDTCEILRFSMDGTGSYPVVGYPLIKNISITGWVEMSAGSASGTGMAGYAGLTELDTDSSDNVYLAHVQDNGSYNFDLYVKKWTDPTWTTVGGGPIMTSIGDQVDDGIFFDIEAADSNKIFVAVMHELPNSDYRIYGKEWNGSSWNELGGSASNDGLSGAATTAITPSVAYFGTSPIVAYVNAEYGNNGIYVKYYNGSSWTGLGGSDSGNGLSSTTQGAWPVIAEVASATGNYPIVAWQDFYSNKFQIYVKRYDVSTSSWVEMGTNSASLGGVSNSSGHAVSPDIVVKDYDEIYLTWQDSYQIYIKKWNGSSWVEVGSGSASGVGISDSSDYAYHPAVTLNENDNPIVTWADHDSGNYEIYVKEYTGSSWVSVGAGAASGGGISSTANDSSFPAITAFANGKPVVSWSDNYVWYRPSGYNYIKQFIE